MGDSLACNEWKRKRSGGARKHRQRGCAIRYACVRSVSLCLSRRSALQGWASAEPVAGPECLCCKVRQLLEEVATRHTVKVQVVRAQLHAGVDRIRPCPIRSYPRSISGGQGAVG